MASSVIFISHGAGASPFFKGSGHEKMVSCLRQMTECLIRPKAIIVISAHWEATQATIGSGAHPELIYDYTGFPEAAYQIKYPAPGNPKLAKRENGNGPMGIRKFQMLFSKLQATCRLQHHKTCSRR